MSRHRPLYPDVIRASRMFFDRQHRSTSVALIIICALALPVAAHGEVVVLPPPAPVPSVQRVEPPSDPLPDWSPQLPMEALHPIAPPVGKCYAPGRICELAPVAAVGRACSCQTANGRVRGRALIPPSHRMRAAG